MSSPVNPYEPSAHASEPLPARQHPDHSPGPHYHARLDWGDRRMLLKSLGPLRLAVVLGGLSWLKGLFDHVTAWADALWRREHQFNELGVVIAALAAFWVFQGILNLYLCRLGWIYADKLQALAGGRTASPREWTRLHYRTCWLLAAVWILMVAQEAGN